MSNLNNLSWLKDQARRLGVIANTDNCIDIIREFWSVNNLKKVNEYGHLAEIAIAFIMGSIQNHMISHGEYFYVSVKAVDDRRQIDMGINYTAFQFKLDWPESSLLVERERLLERGINLVRLVSYSKGEDYSIIDSIIEMMQLANIREEIINDLVDNSESLDIAEEIWGWLTNSLY